MLFRERASSTLTLRWSLRCVRRRRTIGHRRPSPLAHAVVPIPSTIDVSRADSFLVTPRTVVYVDADASAEVEAIGTYAANVIASRAGATAQRLAAGASAPDSSIVLRLDPSRTQLGAEGYELTATKTQVRIVAAQPAGLFHGVQTMRQLLPASVEHPGGSKSAADHAGGARRRHAALRVARRDARRRAPLPRPRRRQAVHRSLRAVQAESAAPASRRRSGLAHRDQVVAEPHGGRRRRRRSAAGAAGSTRRSSTPTSSPTRGRATSPSCPRSTCRATATRRSSRIRICAAIAPRRSRSRASAVRRTRSAPTRDSVYQFVGDVVREISAAAPTPYFHFGGDEVAGLTQGAVSRLRRARRAHRRLDRSATDRLGRDRAREHQPRTIVQQLDARTRATCTRSAAAR